MVNFLDHSGTDMRNKPENFIGKNINKLYIEAVVKLKKGNKLVKCFICTCECGNKCEPIAEKVMRGLTTSCGCFGRKRRLEATQKWKYDKDGKIKKLYNVWSAMKQRCANENHPSYHRYGGRGIKVDQSWKYFENFLFDMKDSYEIGLELDRIDNNGNYCKGNCRWVVKKHNTWNKSSDREYVTSKYTGVYWHKAAKKWCATCGHKYLGIFESEISAALAYDEYCIKERGIYANLNYDKFPEDFNSK